MYLFFDRDGILKEQITTSPVRYGDGEGVNKIYAYWDNSATITNAWCILRKPNGDNTLPIYYSTETDTIPYDPERDLKFFKYNTTYTFLVFEIPEDVFDEVSGIEIYSVLGSVYIVTSGEPKAMGLFAFAVEPSTLSVAADQNINVAQWNALVNMITGNPDYNNISVQTITFKASGSASDSGLSMVNNVIYWRGSALTTASDLTEFITQSDLASYVTFNDLEDYAQKTDLENYVNLTSNQNINGEKSFLGALRSGPNGSITINRLLESIIATIQNIDNDNQKIDTYQIAMVDTASNQNYKITLPSNTGQLALVSQIASYVTNNAVLLNNTGQEIDGLKKFIKKLQLYSGLTFNISSNEDGTIYDVDFVNTDTYKHDIYQIIIDKNTNNRQISLKLPTTSGTLALTSQLPSVPVTDVTVNGSSVLSGTTAQITVPTKTSDLNNDSGFITDANVMTTNTNQNITGQKTFNSDIVINNKKLYIDNATIPQNGSEVVLERFNVIDNDNNGNEATYDILSGNIETDGAEYNIYLPPISGELLSENGFQRVTGQKRFKHLNVDIETSASPTVNGAFWYKSGKFYGRKAGSDKEFLLEDALTPTYFTATSANEVVFDTTSRNCFKFEIGSNYNGIYVFTHSYLMMLVPIYGLTENQIYKFAGPGISDWTTGSVINSLYNMKRSGNYLYIWSGKSDYQLATGINGTLAKIKLY